MSDKIISIGNQIIKMGSGMLGYNDVFTPYDITNMIAWYDASDLSTITKTNDYISQWRDKSGLNYHLDQSNASYQPLYISNVLNSKSVVRFDGINDYMSKNFGTSYNQPITIIIVYKITGTNPTQIIFDGTTSTNRLCLYTQSGFLRLTGANATVNLDYSKTVPYSNFIVNTCVSNSPYFANYENNVLKASATDSRIGNTNPINSFLIGCYYPLDNYFFKGDIAEIIIYNRALTQLELANVNNYLNSKYLIY